MRLNGFLVLFVLVTVAAGMAYHDLQTKARLAQEAELACVVMNIDRLSLETRLSPLDSVSFTIEDGPVKICYGRPSAKGRAVMDSLVPYGQLWRTGANEPTMIHTSVALDIAGIEVEPGTYSLYTVPGESEWQVIVNRSTSQWGRENNYSDEVRAQEVGRATVRAGSTGEFVETFTISAIDGESGGVSVVLEWENTRVAIPVSGAS